MHLSLRFVTKFMTARAVAVNAPARNEKENSSQAPALSEVQSSRRVGGTPAKESPARHVSRPPARGSPVYKESAGAAAGAGRRARPPAGEPGNGDPLPRAMGTLCPGRAVGHPPLGLRLSRRGGGEGVSPLRGGLTAPGMAEGPRGQRSGGGWGWLLHGAGVDVGSLLNRSPPPPRGAPRCPRLGPGLGCSPARLCSAPSDRGQPSAGLSAGSRRLGGEGGGRARASGGAGGEPSRAPRSAGRRPGRASLPVKEGRSRRGKREVDGKGNSENSPHLCFFLIFDFNCVGRIFRFLWIIPGHGPATEVRTLSGNGFVLDFLPQDFVNKCTSRPQPLTVSLRPRQVFYQTKGRCFSSFINSALREAGSKRTSKIPGLRVGPGQGGLRQPLRRAPRTGRGRGAAPASPRAQPGPGRGGERRGSARGGGDGSAIRGELPSPPSNTTHASAARGALRGKAASAGLSFPPPAPG